MARGRIIEKSISTSKKLSKVSDGAALLYSWIIPHTDDFGHIEAEPHLVKSIVVPLRDSMTLEVVTKLLDELYNIGLATRYQVGGDVYLEIYKFNDFQTFRSDRERKPKYPLPPDCHTTDIPVVENRHRREEKVSEVKLREEKLSKEKKEEAFQRFWKSYPKKENKKKAQELWHKKNVFTLEIDLILSFVEKAINTDRWKKGYIKNPTTFLNTESWNDDLTSYRDMSKSAANVLDQGSTHRNKTLEALKGKTKTV